MRRLPIYISIILTIILIYLITAYNSYYGLEHIIVYSPEHNEIYTGVRQKVASNNLWEILTYKNNHKQILWLDCKGNTDEALKCLEESPNQIIIGDYDEKFSYHDVIYLQNKKHIRLPNYFSNILSIKLKDIVLSKDDITEGKFLLFQIDDNNQLSSEVFTGFLMSQKIYEILDGKRLSLL